MISDRWYLHWLRKASNQEVTGDLSGAIVSLGKAEKYTDDTEELRELNVWRNRLKREASK